MASNIFSNEETEEERNRRWYQKPKNWIRLFYLFLVIAIIVIGLCLSSQIGEFLYAYLRWMRTNLIIGSIAYVCIHIAWVTVALPGTYLILGAGFVYAHILSFWEGVFLATFLSLIGTCIGSIFAFLNGRYVLKECISSSFGRNRKWAVVNHMAEQHGIKFELLLRFNVIPTSVVNYGSAITNVKFSEFLIGLLAFIPDVFVHSLCGAEFAKLKDLINGKMTNAELPLFIGGMVVMCIGLLLTIVLVIYAKKQVDKMMEEQEMQDLNESLDHGVVVVDDDESNDGSVENGNGNGNVSLVKSEKVDKVENKDDKTGIIVSERAPLLA